MFRPSANGSYPAFPTQSWYPPAPMQTAIESTSSGGSTSNNDLRPYSPQQPAPSSSSDIFVTLASKREREVHAFSAEELQKLLSDQDAYFTFLHSLESVRQTDSLWTELLNRTVELAKRNLEKESDIFQLKNQCTIIRTTELAAARERFKEVHKQEIDLKAVYSPAVLLERLHDSASKVDEESEMVFQQLLSGEISLADFLQTYRRMRLLYHKRALTQLAAKTSMILPG